MRDREWGGVSIRHTYGRNCNGALRSASRRRLLSESSLRFRSVCGAIAAELWRPSGDPFTPNEDDGGAGSGEFLGSTAKVVKNIAWGLRGRVQDA